MTIISLQFDVVSHTSIVTSFESKNWNICTCDFQCPDVAKNHQLMNHDIHGIRECRVSSKILDANSTHRLKPRK